MLTVVHILPRNHYAWYWRCRSKTGKCQALPWAVMAVWKMSLEVTNLDSVWIGRISTTSFTFGFGFTLTYPSHSPSAPFYRLSTPFFYLPSPSHPFLLFPSLSSREIRLSVWGAPKLPQCVRGAAPADDQLLRYFEARKRNWWHQFWVIFFYKK